jgi:hypothetical protein
VGKATPLRTEVGVDSRMSASVLEREDDYDVPNASSHNVARLPKMKLLQPKKVS